MIYRLFCEVNQVKTQISHHKSRDACSRRYHQMANLFLRVFRNMPYPITLWQEDPNGIVLAQQTLAFHTPALSSAPTDVHAKAAPVADEPLEDQEEWLELFKTLKSLAVTSVYAEYDGSGDSGSLQSVSLRNDNDDEVEVTDTLSDKVDNMLHQVIPAGYENNEGGYVEVILDIPERRVTLNHNARYTDISEESRTWILPSSETPEAITPS